MVDNQQIDAILYITVRAKGNKMTPQERIKDFIARINQKDSSIRFSIEGVEGSGKQDRQGKRCYTQTLKSGVVLEVLYIRNRLMIGVGLPGGKGDQSRPIVVEYLTDNGFAVDDSQKNLRYETDNLDDDFLALYELISDCDLLDPAGASSWKKFDSAGKPYFEIVARFIEDVTKHGNTILLHRHLFDCVDRYITINEPTDVRTYREHIVPCDLLFKHSVEMFQSGASVEQVAEMLKDNLAIAYIDPKDALRLDTELGWRTTMPEGWQFGDAITARLDEAKISY